MTETESSITLEFPDNNYFRICDCTAYKQLQHIREMDFCWYNQNDDKLFLIELKDWGNDSIDEEKDPSIKQDKIIEKKEGIYKYRIKNLLEKSLDTLCMFSSILLKRPLGNRINNCAPFNITTQTDIILLSIINWSSSDDSYISNINTAYRSKFNSYAKLFGIKKYHVLTKTLASKTFDWIK